MELINNIVSFISMHLIAEITNVVRFFEEDLLYMGGVPLNEGDLTFIVVFLCAVLTLFMLIFAFYCVYNVVMFVYRRIFKI